MAAAGVFVPLLCGTCSSCYQHSFRNNCMLVFHIVVYLTFLHQSFVSSSSRGTLLGLGTMFVPLTASLLQSIAWLRVMLVPLTASLLQCRGSESIAWLRYYACTSDSIITQVPWIRVHSLA